MWVRGIQTGCGETGEFDSSFQTEDKKHEHPFFLSESENANSPEGKDCKTFQNVSWIDISDALLV